MRAYSSIDVMSEYLERPSGFIANLIWSMSKSAKVQLEITIPKRLFLKGELITETVREETEKAFSYSDLVDLLVKELLSYYHHQTNPLKLYRVFQEISSSFIITRYYNDSKDELTKVKVALRKSDVFKLEMLLADIEEVEGEHDLTVERVLELHYVNYMFDLLQGNNDESVSRIIKEII
ncbi:hypothetical protein [Metabacillus fastidiosus]|uniref:hypothetical protein n=1 Tax=Metabacillus fastidiosus TaxID=1458 RepID=UPI002E230E64|nr:hypothetical protein [Metabacillus fastidiosus]